MVSVRGPLGGILAVGLVTLAAAEAGGAPPAAAPVAAPSASAAAPVAPAAPATPRVHHAPISIAKEGVRLELKVTVEHPEFLRYMGAIYRTAKGVIRAVPFLRGEGGAYVAIISGDDVTAPGLGYTIEIEQSDGRRVAVFGTRADMQPIVVVEDRADARERALLTRLEGRRSVARVTGEYVGFGTTTGKAIPCAAGEKQCTAGELVVPSARDQYFRLEASYTYRLLGIVSEFGLRMGVVRGQSLVDLNEFKVSKYNVGLNFGSPWVLFRFADAWHLEVSALTSISEVGFAIGLGNALLIGDPYGTKLTLGWDTVGLAKGTYFGTRFLTRLDILVTQRIIVGPSIEVTDMPHAETFGVRLLGDASLAIWRGLGASIRGGYQARKSTSGGPTAGASLWLGF